jgi:hypothetical protein
MILTGLKIEGLELSRKHHYFDRFSGREAKAVKKAP